jgi:hypothetical protein
MQDRYYVIAIVLVIAICCLGGYVAISGYLNANPPSISLLTPGAPVTVVLLSTDTPAPASPVVAVARTPTVAAVPSPLGAFQTIAAATTPGAPVPTTRPATVPPAQPQQPPSQGCGFPFCPKSGPPDSSIAPGGNECPRNYIWGRIVDVGGIGLPNVRIRFRGPLGDSDQVVSKGPPDPPGIYNILAPSGEFTIWIPGEGGAIDSPQIRVTVQGYQGVGECPTRLDWIRQR